jgi:hypothetical protein
VSARETAELLVQVGRRVQAEGYDGGLSPAQWMALRFFARANQFSRNPSAFAGFQATTRGTAPESSYEWCASADRCLSGLHALRQRDALQPAERGPFGR